MDFRPLQSESSGHDAVDQGGAAQPPLVDLAEQQVAELVRPRDQPVPQHVLAPPHRQPPPQGLPPRRPAFRPVLRPVLRGALAQELGQAGSVPAWPRGPWRLFWGLGADLAEASFQQAEEVLREVLGLGVFHSPEAEPGQQGTWVYGLFLFGLGN